MRSLINVLSLSQQRCPHPIQGRLAYAGRENFMGRVVEGYAPDASDKILMSPLAAEALCLAQMDLNSRGLGLYVYDSYRPLRAVRDFGKWMHAAPESDYELLRKQIHYPDIDKNHLSVKKYLNSEVSRHCFGHVVDLSLIEIDTHKPLEMGACFDYFGAISHIDAMPQDIGERAYRNRQILSETMQKNGYLTYALEFWHFEYQIQECLEAMDFPITADV